MPAIHGSLRLSHSDPILVEPDPSRDVMGKNCTWMSREGRGGNMIAHRTPHSTTLAAYLDIYVCRQDDVDGGLFLMPGDSNGICQLISGQSTSAVGQRYNAEPPRRWENPCPKFRFPSPSGADLQNAICSLSLSISTTCFRTAGHSGIAQLRYNVSSPQPRLPLLAASSRRCQLPIWRIDRVGLVEVAHLPRKLGRHTSGMRAVSEDPLPQCLTFEDIHQP